MMISLAKTHPSLTYVTKTRLQPKTAGTRDGFDGLLLREKRCYTAPANKTRPQKNNGHVLPSN